MIIKIIFKDYAYFNINNNINVVIMDQITIKIYVVNLKRRPDRLEHFYNTCSFPKEKIHVVYGFDGKNYDNELENEKHLYNKLSHNLLPGEKGCFISHMRMFKDIVANKIPYAIIFEDDGNFCHDFKNKLELCIHEMPSDTKILYFGGRFSPDFKMDLDTFVPITEHIVAHTNVDWYNRDCGNHDRCTFGYIISCSLAQYFIDCFEANFYLDFAIDNWMVKICMDNKIPIYNTCPLLCYSDIVTKDSDIRGHLC
jgi:GR25 family glycosyltransferase involved in LPS biosynthesis